ncbi:hypothetical protein HK103_002841 [Boothiomyces macroporosus]|uniref:Uncharacterized protein n=1 Tax=Boothiomyces macroporosus TaxID=261099 RepID=A0AAD5Y9E3_9FUNG|nr:hypothetical protein HK103_002821 [Boothiomyces macroporosus]KAJ3259194.1 hypothetical protein HK103_002841 [Boothiomyces macroporosus]
MLRKLINRIKVIDLPWSPKRFRGYDLDGNMYFEEPSRREGISQSRRFVKYADGRYNPHEYDPNMIPIQ